VGGVGVSVFRVVEGQEGFRPLVPEFSVDFVNHPVEVPPVTSTDPYTGVTTYTPGYSVDKWSLDISMKNQPFTPYIDVDGKEVNLYYSVDSKGHFENQWKLFARVLVQSDLEYTVVSDSKFYSVGSQVDFRVSAVIGYRYLISDNTQTSEYGFKVVEASDYSDVYTFTQPGQTSWPSSSFDVIDSGDRFNYFLLGISILLGGIVIIPLAINTYHYKKKKEKIEPQTRKPRHNWSIPENVKCFTIHKLSTMYRSCYTNPLVTVTLKHSFLFLEKL